MSERPYQEPYEAAQQRYDQTLAETLEVLTEASRQIETMDTEHPLLESRLGRNVLRLWKKDLGLRPLPRLWRKVPHMPAQRIDRRLRGLRRQRLGGVHKGMRRLSTAPGQSWPGRRRRLAMAFMELRLRLSPGWALVLLVVLALALIDAIMPSAFEDVFDAFFFQP